MDNELLFKPEEMNDVRPLPFVANEPIIARKSRIYANASGIDAKPTSLMMAHMAGMNEMLDYMEKDLDSSLCFVSEADRSVFSLYLGALRKRRCDVRDLDVDPVTQQSLF